MSAGLAYERTTVEPYSLPPRAGGNIFREVEQLLFYEAELLDNFKLLDWTKLLAPDIEYRIPIRSSVDSLEVSDGFSKQRLPHGGRLRLVAGEDGAPHRRGSLVREAAVANPSTCIKPARREGRC